MGLVVVACGFSCPEAGGISVLRPEIEPAPLALQGGFPNHRTIREVPIHIMLNPHISPQSRNYCLCLKEWDGSLRGWCCLYKVHSSAGLYLDSLIRASRAYPTPKPLPLLPPRFMNGGAYEEFSTMPPSQEAFL